MAKNDNKRFVTVYSDNNMLSSTAVLVDRVTGVNYLWHEGANSGGLCPLLAPDGKPVVTPLSDFDEK